MQEKVEVKDHFFVITGGPGSGKSSLLDALEQAGYSRSVEAGRAIIQDHVSIGGQALPWDDRALFSELMLSWEMRSYRMAQSSTGPAFFDRGVPDVMGYLRLIGSPIPGHVQRAVETFRYNPNVFIAPPWREIFQQDHERKQDFDEAVRTYDALARVYAESGYNLIELPKASIDARASFVLRQVSSLL